MMIPTRLEIVSVAGLHCFWRAACSLRAVLFGLFISLFLVACGEEVAHKSSVPDFILQLDDSNMHDFTVNFAHDYLNTLETLVNASSTYRQADDGDGLTTFRNQQWTPQYIEKKGYYDAVLQKNKPNIYRASINPLFDIFDRLLSISVNLKHAVLDHDTDRWERALELANRDKQAVIALIKASGERQRLTASSAEVQPRSD